MPAIKYIFIIILLCVIAASVAGCHTSQPAVVSRPAKPRFISNVYIDPHKKVGATADAIDHKRYPQKPKPAPKPQHTVVKTVSAAPPAASVVTRKPVEDSPSVPVLSASIKKKYAGILGVDESLIANFTLFQFIDKWIGTDYRAGGCDINGIDCSGFAQKLYSEVYGIDLLRTSMEQFANCKRIKASKDAQEGDLVFFHIRGKRISHVGVYLANDYFVHASTTGGVMISRLDEEYWHKYYAGCGRVPKS